MAMRTDDEILMEMKERKSRGSLSANDPFLRGDTNPLTTGAIENAESRLGFRIPLLLRAIYREVSNGGFGDAYGFLGLVGGPRNEDRMDCVSLYEAYKQSDAADEFWNWPTGLLPMCHLGCAMYHCVDCTKPLSPIIWFEPNPHERGREWDDSFFPFCDSLTEYLSSWLDGVDLWERLEDA